MAPKGIQVLIPGARDFVIYLAKGLGGCDSITELESGGSSGPSI